MTTIGRGLETAEDKGGKNSLENRLGEDVAGNEREDKKFCCPFGNELATTIFILS